MIGYEIASAAFGALIAAVIIYLVRRDHLHGRYALLWIPAAVGVASLGIFPGISDWIGRHLGVNYPPVIPLVVGLCFVLIKLLSMDIERSRNEGKLHRLVQRVGMLEAALMEAGKAEAKGATAKHQNDAPPEALEALENPRQELVNPGEQKSLSMLMEVNKMLRGASQPETDLRTGKNGRE